MNKKRLQYRQTIRFLFLMTDVALLTLQFVYMWMNTYNAELPKQYVFYGVVLLALIYAVVLTAFICLMKGNNIGQPMMEVIVSQIIAVVLGNVLTYFQVSLLAYTMLNPLGFVILTACQAAVICLLAYVGNRIYYKIYRPHEMLLIYEERRDLPVLFKLNSIAYRYNITSVLQAGVPDKVIERAMLGFDSVILAIRNEKLQADILETCYRMQKRTYFVPTISNIMVRNSKDIHVVDTPLMFAGNQSLTKEQMFYKRLIDIVISSVALLLLSPLFGIIALLIKAEDKGPVFFRQERLTMHGKVFNILKFRTMLPNAEELGARLAEEDDPRITHVGKFLRKSRLDELPQLLNVLHGEMSIVGPRPECPSIAEEYEKILPRFSYRLKVKAGITGYAQVFGNYSTSAEDKLLLDMMYIEKYSLMLDISLMLLTLRVFFMPYKTRGLAAGRMIASGDAEDEIDAELDYITKNRAAR